MFWQKIRKNQKQKVVYMVTPLQKYNGNNIKNNRVVVDYVNKKVHFQPVCYGQAWRGLLNFYLLVFVVSFYLSLIIAYIHVGIFYIIYRSEIPTILRGLLVVSVISISLLNVLLIYLRMRGKYFKTEIYPKLNSFLSDAIKLWTGKNKITFLKENLYQNMAIIPVFSNVVLEYELFGDAKLKEIIINNHHKDEYRWYGIVSFVSFSKKLQVRGEV